MTGCGSWGGARYIVKPSTPAAVDDLREQSPNFVNVVDDLRKHLALAVAGNEAVQFTPILLLGEPVGLGLIAGLGLIVVGIWLASNAPGFFGLRGSPGPAPR